MFPQQYCRLQYYFSVIQREKYFQTVNTKQLWNITSHIKIKINIKTLTFFQQIKNKAQSQTCLSLSFHDIQYIWIICSAVLSFIDLTDFFLMEVPQIRRATIIKKKTVKKSVYHWNEWVSSESDLNNVSQRTFCSEHFSSPFLLYKINFTFVCLIYCIIG